MPLTDVGAIVIAKLIMGDSQVIYNLANAKLGVGNSNAAFAKTQTDLQHATLKQRKPVDSGFPTRVNNVISYRATFVPADAVFIWNEWGLFNAFPTGGDMLNRKVEALGDKPSSQSWQFNVDIAFTA